MSDEFIEKILNISYRKNEYEHDDAFSMYKSFWELFPDVEIGVFEPIKKRIGRNVFDRNLPHSSRISVLGS